MPTISRHSQVICHHCGSDYAREYWDSADPGDQLPLEPKVDPCVCLSCRRDTNPDAADAPLWTPREVQTFADEPLIVSPARKQCRVCRGEWDGLVFGLSASKGSPLPFGICPTCDAQEETRLVAFTHRPRTVETPPAPLQRPTRVFGYDD